MKKTNLLILSVTALMSLGVIVGCGSKTPSTNPSNDTPTVQPSEEPSVSPSTPESSTKPSSEEPSLPPAESSEAPVLNPEITNTGVSIVVRAESVYLTFSGTYKDMEPADILALAPKFDAQDLGWSQNADGSDNWNGSWEYEGKDLTPVVTASDGVWSATYEVTGFSRNAHTLHFSLEGKVNPSTGNNANECVDFKITTAVNETVETETSTYKLTCVPGSTKPGEFCGCVGLTIEDKPVEEAKTLVLGDNTVSYSNYSTEYTFTAPAAGSYKVVAADDDGCLSSGGETKGPNEAFYITLAEGEAWTVEIGSWNWAEAGSYIVTVSEYTPAAVDHTLVQGTWTGTLLGYGEDEEPNLDDIEDVTIVVNEDLTGTYRGSDVTWEYQSSESSSLYGAYRYMSDDYSYDVILMVNKDGSLNVKWRNMEGDDYKEGNFNHPSTPAVAKPLVLGDNTCDFDNYSTTYVFTAPAAGSYKIISTDDDGCLSSGGDTKGPNEAFYITLDEGETWEVEIGSWNWNASGSYIVTVSEYTPTPVDHTKVHGEWTGTLLGYGEDEEPNLDDIENVTIVVNEDLTGTYRGSDVTWEYQSNESSALYGSYRYMADDYSYDVILTVNEDGSLKVKWRNMEGDDYKEGTFNHPSAETVIENKDQLVFGIVDTWGMTDEYADSLISAFEEYAKVNGITLPENILIKHYEGSNLATVSTAIAEDGKADILLGTGANWTSNSASAYYNNTDVVPAKLLLSDFISASDSGQAKRYTTYLTTGDNAEIGATWINFVTIRLAKVTSITVTGEATPLYPGEKVQLTATFNEDATVKTVKWTSSDTTKATVDDTGKVTCVAAGEVTITATSTVDPSVSGEFKLTLVDYTTVDFADLKNHVGEKVKTTGYLSNYAAGKRGYLVDANGDNGVYLDATGGGLVSGQVGYAIDVAGTVSQDADGHYIISAAGAVSTSATITTPITLTPTTVTELTIANYGEIVKVENVVAHVETLENGTEQRYVMLGETKVILYQDASLYNESKAKIASLLEGTKLISLQGCVTTYNGNYQMLLLDSNIVVDNTLTSITLTAPENATELGGEETLQLTATANPGGELGTLTWTSSDDTKATVDANGLVTGVASGEATITATAENGVAGTYVITVYANDAAVESVSVSLNKTQIGVGANAQATATVAPKNAADKSVTWSSSDETIATVDATGKVTAVKAGEATIIATSTDGGVQGSAKITVVESTTLSIDFAADTKYSTWSTSYTAHTETVGVAEVKFSAANKQSATSTINDVPVQKGGNYTVYVGDVDIQEFTAVSKQWDTKTQNVTISYSLDGETWVTAVAATNAFAEGGVTADLSAVAGNVQYIKVTYSNNSNQVGLVGCEIIYL